MSLLLAGVVLAGCGSRWESTRQPAPERVAAGYYVVRPGDTLYSIAFRHGLSHSDLAGWNDLDDPTRIYPGQQLRLTVPAKRTASRPIARPPPPVERIDWRWPTDGRLVTAFDVSSNTKQTGILIDGQPGQPVVAAADGQVVYAGSGLKGYGKLIIIQHSTRYLSAYGHNAALLVEEGDDVARGQKIATMGEMAAARPRLHFEIRLDGEPVDPMPLLRASR